MHIRYMRIINPFYILYIYSFLIKFFNVKNVIPLNDVKWYHLLKMLNYSNVKGQQTVQRKRT